MQCPRIEATEVASVAGAALSLAGQQFPSHAQDTLQSEVLASGGVLARKILLQRRMNQESKDDLPKGNQQAVNEEGEKVEEEKKPEVEEEKKEETAEEKSEEKTD